MAGRGADDAAGDIAGDSQRRAELADARHGDPRSRCRGRRAYFFIPCREIWPASSAYHRPWQRIELAGRSGTLRFHASSKILAFVRRHGHTLEGLTKRSVSAVLAHNPSDNVRQLLELRRAGARATPTSTILLCSRCRKRISVVT
jgi:hypothetical protein